MAKVKSTMNKTIFQSYTDVIDNGIRAGKDVSVVVKRLNHLKTAAYMRNLMAEYKKKV